MENGGQPEKTADLTVKLPATTSQQPPPSPFCARVVTPFRPRFNARAPCLQPRRTDEEADKDKVVDEALEIKGKGGVRRAEDRTELESKVLAEQADVQQHKGICR